MRTVLFYLTVFWVISSAVAADRQPNIVIILADDLGWNDVSYHGGEIATPHIDQLAHEGVELNRFYVAPICSPTRSGLMTGRYPVRFGLMRSTVTPWGTFGLSKEEELLPEVLAAAGYRHRAIIGKWHLGHGARKFHPLSRGFSFFYGHYNGAVDYFTHYREGELDWHRNFKADYTTGYTTDLCADEAVLFIETHADDGPFFLYVPFNAPHGPHQAKPEDLRKYAHLTGRTMPEKAPGTYASQGRGKNARQTLAAMISAMDDGIGRILATLEKQGIAGNTLVLFSSDNGGSVQVADNSPLRGGKDTVFEGGIRVPAAIRWPDELTGGRRLDAPLSYIDILPTLRRILDIDAPPRNPLDGIDCLDILRGREEAPARKMFSYTAQYGEEKESLSVMTPDWKLVRLGPNILRDDEASRAGAELLLFRITEDPFEQRNLADRHPDIVRDLLREIAGFRALEPENTVRPYLEGKEGFQAPPEWRFPDTH
jgi:arylsulfatase B